MYEYDAHEGWIWRIIYLKNKTQIISSGADKKIAIWN